MDLQTLVAAHMPDRRHPPQMNASAEDRYYREQITMPRHEPSPARVDRHDRGGDPAAGRRRPGMSAAMLQQIDRAMLRSVGIGNRSMDDGEADRAAILAVIRGRDRGLAAARLRGMGAPLGAVAAGPAAGILGLARRSGGRRLGRHRRAHQEDRGAVPGETCLRRDESAGKRSTSSSTGPSPGSPSTRSAATRARTASASSGSCTGSTGSGRSPARWCWSARSRRRAAR